MNQDQEANRQIEREKERVGLDGTVARSTETDKDRVRKEFDPFFIDLVKEYDRLSKERWLRHQQG